MIIPGYLDGYVPPVEPSVLVDATAWLEDPVFWPAFLLSVGGSRTAAEAFDVDHADLDAMLASMERPDQWPVLLMDVHGDHRLHLVWRNLDGDAGWDYLLTLAGSDEAIELGALEGGFRGPAWSWDELVVVAQQPDRQRSAAERLLLLLPAMGDADVPPSGAAIVAKAVTAVGGQRDQIAVAHELLGASGRFWGGTAWTRIAGVPVCLGQHSPRGRSAPIAQLRSIAQAFTAR